MVEDDGRRREDRGPGQGSPGPGHCSRHAVRPEAGPELIRCSWLHYGACPKGKVNSQEPDPPGLLIPDEAVIAISAVERASHSHQPAVPSPALRQAMSFF